MKGVQVADIRFASKNDLKSLAQGIRTNYVKDPEYVHTDTNYSNDDKSKLDGITRLTNAEIEAITQS